MKKRLVVLTGAGISAESGIPTFRGKDGLWMGHKIEDVATPDGFKRDPKKVLEFYNIRRKDVAKAKPNEAHFQLAQLEDLFHVVVITQNIDDLHERAGSTNIIHLHGEIFKKCSADKSIVEPVAGDITLGELAPDGSQWRPFVVWFNESVSNIEDAFLEVEIADYFAVIGTSLQVYPAATLTENVKPGSSQYLVDVKIPSTPISSNVTCIEMPASKGVTKLAGILRKIEGY